MTTQEALANGTIGLATGTDLCNTCSNEPDVLDGPRKAAFAKYTFNGTGYCGTHIRPQVSGNEYTWNANRQVYVPVRKTQPKAKKVTKADVKYYARKCKVWIVWDKVQGCNVEACYTHWGKWAAGQARCDKATKFDNEQKGAN